MSKVIVVDRIIEDSIQCGYNFIEKNDLENGVKYLEYAYENLPNDSKDIEYLTYALITTFYNLGIYEKVNMYMSNVNINMIQSETIKEVIVQIREDIEDFNEHLNEKMKKINNVYFDKFTYSKAKKEKLAKLFPKNFEHTLEYMNFDIKIKQISSFLMLKHASGYFENSNNILHKLILEFDLIVLLENDGFEKIKTILDIIKENKFFKDELADCLNIALMFKQFWTKAISQENFLEAQEIYKKAQNQNEFKFFLYQGITSNLFNCLLNNEFLDSYFKNEIAYDIILYTKKGLIPKEITSKVKFELLNIEFEKFDKKLEDIKNMLESIDESKNFIEDCLILATKYLKFYLDDLNNIKSEELAYNILVYLYYSDYELSNSLEKKILDRIDITDIKNEVRYNEINKITLNNKNML